MTKDLHRQQEIKNTEEDAQSREPLSEILDELNTYSIKAFEKAIPDMGSEDKPGTNPTVFHLTLDKSWWGEQIREVEMKFLTERKTLDISDEYLTSRVKQYPLTPEESIPSCGQRYERENQNQN